jgi:hypothetical protein
MVTTPAVSAALQDLVADGTLTAAQADRVAARLAVAADPSAEPAAGPVVAPARQGGRLAEIAGYAGGALLLGAVALFLSTGWSDLSDPSQIAVLTGTAVLLIVAGAVIAVGGDTSLRDTGHAHDSARRRLVSVLWTVAAASTAGAAGLAVDGYELVAASAVGLVVAGVGYRLMPSAVGQLGGWLAAIGLVSGLIGELGDEPGTWLYAVALVSLGAVWAGLAVTRVLDETESGLALGAGLALFAAQLPLIDSDHELLGYLLTAGVAAAGFAGYLATRSWAVLGAGVLGTTFVVPEALHDWTDGSVSAAGSLLVAGLTLLAASAIGLRLRREVR